MKKEQTYFGIYFNDKIPKIDKINKYNKEVEIKFEGKAFLIKRDDNNKVIDRIELTNKDKLKKEKDYEIEFINNENKTYHLRVRIESSYLFLILLLFLIGFLIGLILTKPVNNSKNILNKIADFIDLSIVSIDIDKTKENNSEIENTKEVQEQYFFDAIFKNISTDDINLTNTINAQALVKNKVAPGVSRKFLYHY